MGARRQALGYLSPELPGIPTVPTANPWAPRPSQGDGQALERSVGLWLGANVEGLRQERNSRPEGIGLVLNCERFEEGHTGAAVGNAGRVEPHGGKTQTPEAPGPAAAIKICQAHHLCLFRGSNGLEGAEAAAEAPVTGLYLHEDESAALVGNDVDLTGSRSPIAFEDVAAGSQKIPDNSAFAPAADTASIPESPPPSRTALPEVPDARRESRVDGPDTVL